MQQYLIKLNSCIDIIKTNLDKLLIEILVDISNILVFPLPLFTNRFDKTLQFSKLVFIKEYIKSLNLPNN